MATAIQIKAENRQTGGSSAARRMRRTNRIPAVLYGGDESHFLALNEHDFNQMMRKHRSEHLLVDLVVAGEDEPRKALLKDVQHHPVSGKPLHVDFQAVALDQRLRLEVPIELTGIPQGVSQQGGVLELLIREIEIECLATDIPESIELDVSALEIGHSLTVADLKLDPARHTVLTDADLAVAGVTAPRVSAEAVAEEGAAVAEPELAGKKPDAEPAK
ncbi:MAG: 50S ribosomal protein L25 [Candidatus Marinimicrobia bacterium]|nr:50S ribosomal protein L25 [Candidatus Neomarinimicrobiota bacterium]